MARIAPLLLLFTLLLPRPAAADPGVLLLAHGGSDDWNRRVTALAGRVDRTRPTEVAFGMATRSTIQSAIGRLVARGVSEIVAVPLFVSSASSIITSTEYLLGLRAEAPPALAIFAAMPHDGQAGDHATHPVESPVPVRMTAALDDHPIVADILVTRARTISRAPSGESLILVAHGPNSDDDNQRWVANLASLGRRVSAILPFASVDQLTVRDDAPAEVRDRAAAELRALVARHADAGRRVLILPVVISFGGIEQGLRERLDGLDYAMPTDGLAPDDRLADWVLAMASR